MLRHLKQKLQLLTSSDGQKFSTWYYLATDIAKGGVEENIMLNHKLNNNNYYLLSW